MRFCIPVVCNKITRCVLQEQYLLYGSYWNSFVIICVFSAYKTLILAKISFTNINLHRAIIDIWFNIKAANISLLESYMRIVQSQYF